MYNNINVRVINPFVDRLPDNSLRSLPIDQFIVSDKSMYKSDGFPRSDVSLLDRFNKSNVDPDLVNQVAARMQEISADESMKDFSDDMKLKLLRPAWCQTASEMAAFSEQVYQVLEASKEDISKNDIQSVTASVVGDDTQKVDSPAETN